MVDPVTKIIDSNDGGLTVHANVAAQSTASAGISVANPVPAAAVSAVGLSGDAFIDNVTYKGAFSVANWAAGWSRTFQ